MTSGTGLESRAKRNSFTNTHGRDENHLPAVRLDTTESSRPTMYGEYFQDGSTVQRQEVQHDNDYQHDERYNR